MQKEERNIRLESQLAALVSSDPPAIVFSLVIPCRLRMPHGIPCSTGYPATDLLPLTDPFTLSDATGRLPLSFTRNTCNACYPPHASQARAKDARRDAATSPACFRADVAEVEAEASTLVAVPCVTNEVEAAAAVDGRDRLGTLQHLDALRKLTERAASRLLITALDVHASTADDAATNSLRAVAMSALTLVQGVHARVRTARSRTAHARGLGCARSMA